MTLREQLAAIAAAATHYKPGLPSGASSEPFIRVQGFTIGDREPTSIAQVRPGLFDVLYTTDAGAFAWRMWIRSTAKLHFGNAASEQLRLFG